MASTGYRFQTEPTRSNMWQCPSFVDSKGRPNTGEIIAWFNTSLANGLSYLGTQTGYKDIDDSIALLRGEFIEKKPQKLSQLYLNKYKQYVREKIGILSNIRPLTDFKSDPSTDPINQQTALQLNNLYKAWYLEQHVDDKIDEALQWAEISKGYLEIFWDPPDDFDADGNGHIAIAARGPRNVIPVQMPPDGNIQLADSVFIQHELPLNLVKAKWPEWANDIVPDRQSPSAAKYLFQRAQRTFMSMFGPGSRTDSTPTPFPMVDVFYCYVRDHSLNLTDHDIDMAPGKVWGYKVPPLTDPDGQVHKVWTGLYDDQQQQIMRPVGRKECMLYPNRRLIICTRTQVFYDGPSYWWHGKVPLVVFDGDKWVFEYLGFSSARDAKSIQDSVNGKLRASDDADNCRLRPALLVDSQAVAQSEYETIDTRIPGAQYMMPMQSTDNPIKPLMPVGFYERPANIAEEIRWEIQQMSELLMLPQVKQLAAAKQVPSGDSIEKLQELAGPGMTKLSRRMEKALRDLGEMWKWLVFEFYTTAIRSQYLGDDGVTMVDFDYDPGNMIPDMLDEHPELAGPENRYRRARLHGKKFKFQVVPNSMHAMTQWARKQLYALLWKMQFPIDPWTIANAYDMIEFGPPPPGTKTMWERWLIWSDIRAKLAGFLQKEMTQAAQPEGGGEGGEGGEGGPGQGAGGGRPQTLQTAPHMQMKDQGTRITQSTSK